MSLDHRFILLKAADHRLEDYLPFTGESQGSHVHDDLLRYMGDSLQWVHTINPARRDGNGYGLNLCGPTVISTEGAELAAQIFRTWANLFRLGPETLVLTGAWCETEGISGQGHYSRVTVSRDPLVSTLDKIAEDCRRVAASAGALYLLHLGV
jgi:hypothetical protein